MMRSIVGQRMQLRFTEKISSHEAPSSTIDCPSRSKAVSGPLSLVGGPVENARAFASGLHVTGRACWDSLAAVGDRMMPKR